MKILIGNSVKQSKFKTFPLFSWKMDTATQVRKLLWQLTVISCSQRPVSGQRMELILFTFRWWCLFAVSSRPNVSQIL